MSSVPLKTVEIDENGPPIEEIEEVQRVSTFRRTLPQVTLSNQSCNSIYGEKTHTFEHIRCCNVHLISFPVFRVNSKKSDDCEFW